MNERNFGDRLKELRVRMGKSQSEAVQDMQVLFQGRARMSQSTLSALEQRETAPREDVLEILSEYYGVPITFFFDESDDDSQEIINVRSYIEALRFHTPDSAQRFAHSSEKRSQNDELQQILDSFLLIVKDFLAVFRI